MQINHVTKKYQNFTALKDINLELNYGIYGLLAPNGAGKTTLMKMLATLLYPTEGMILWEGREIQKLDDKYREKLGFLLQDFGYYRDYTTERYLRYIGILKGIGREQLKMESNFQQKEIFERFSQSRACCDKGLESQVHPIKGKKSENDGKECGADVSAFFFPCFWAKEFSRKGEMIAFSKVL
nr:ATP-binding cassette domain-containing protein [Faecalicatena faecalis]